MAGWAIGRRGGIADTWVVVGGCGGEDIRADACAVGVVVVVTWMDGW